MDSASCQRRLEAVKTQLTPPKLKLLIANRGEIAIRLSQAAQSLPKGAWLTVAIYPQDDAQSLHISQCDEAVLIPGVGVAAYLNGAQIVKAAKEVGGSAIAPGYGFLSENAEFARLCESEGLIFVGPSPKQLELYGDKISAKALARQAGVNVVHGTFEPTTLEQVVTFFKSLPSPAAVMIKARSGGGGRGMRPVFNLEELPEAYQRCASEALTAFGDGALFVEQLVMRPRHVEVQVIGDGKKCIHLWERECSFQRKNQKVIEIAPAPNLSKSLRHQILDAALKMARVHGLRTLATFEFLVAPNGDFFFMEVNPRLQVEHTVTEDVTGLDLVHIQLQLAFGATLKSLGLSQSPPPPTTYAIQLRICTEEVDPISGSSYPSIGTITRFEMPSGRGIRIDSCGFTGMKTSMSYDTLVSKIVLSGSPSFEALIPRAIRALRNTRIVGVKSNVPFLLALLAHPAVVTYEIYTRFIEDNAQELAANLQTIQAQIVSAPSGDSRGSAPPSALLNLGDISHLVKIESPIAGLIVSTSVKVGDIVTAGQELVLLESMKMENVIKSPQSGRVTHVLVKNGDVYLGNLPLILLEPNVGDSAEENTKKVVDLERIRPDLQELLDRKAVYSSSNRPTDVQKRAKVGARMAWDNVMDLFDGEFFEYGALAIAVQRSRRTLEDLRKNTSRDGIISGFGHVNSSLFSKDKTRTAVLAYDYTVLVGTQGWFTHKKKDRILELCMKHQIPLIIYAEGGGGRPGDVDTEGVFVAGLNIPTFMNLARLSATVPLICVVNGNSFAGNAALASVCDVIIATQSTSLGMGGPAMIEYGGLGKVVAKDVGPPSVQVPNGVIDILCRDEAEATYLAKKYLSYFQGPTQDWKCADQRRLRSVIPENRLRVYDVREAIHLIADTDSVLELRSDFGLGMITALIRIEGKPFGLMANNSMHQGGAIDAPAGDKAARWIQLCDAFDLPLISLCDTPGFLVGAEAEKTAQVRHFGRQFIAVSTATIPIFCVILRKGYGLGAMAMGGGSLDKTFCTIAWPSSEFGGMGLEGSVRLGYKKELEAILDPRAREKRFEELVARMYSIGKGISAAEYLEIDEIIDPADTRNRLIAAWHAVGPPKPRREKKRTMVDAW